MALLLISASAISIETEPAPATTEPTQGDQNIEDYQEGQFGVDGLPEMDSDMLILTTYIGFEFEGALLADIFSELSGDEQNEIRLMVEDLIYDYYDEKMTEEGQDKPTELDAEQSEGMTLA